MSKQERKSILYYWSIRYFVILFISIMALGLLAMYAFYQASLNSQRHRLESMSGDLAAIAADNGGKLPDVPSMARFLEDIAASYDLTDRPIMFILDQDGNIVQQFPENPPEETQQVSRRLSEITTKVPHTIKLKSSEDKEPYLASIHPIRTEDSVAGYALYAAIEHNALDGMFAFRYPRWILLSSFLLIGWCIVYMMMRRLIRSIQEAAGAAQQIVAGDYQIQFEKSYKEKELYELTHSFKTMADRLSRLEALRTQLLAGVTHEFKTPVTSISGLIQAVRKKVVRGKEAELFLDHCLNECNRLQKMVEDLLDFNSFASGSINVNNEIVHLETVVAAILSRWRYGQDGATIEVVMETTGLEANLHVSTDPSRLEQILINLLNNARDALAEGGLIVVQLISDPLHCRIRVRDTGCGIPAEEQIDVFEPFFRGSGKKTRVHGLGLGLPFTRMIAHSMGGDLQLTESSPSGTTFTLVIPASHGS
ncbi:HAMP domain-containing sensor histidine kinase [Paenibacillus sp. HB172176]|uniref:HAMP domain-containing sensor histidine kinase n=1 Tax=Paenibacillus sp. HB172176 TaxID=2493690 RepID=UPI001439D00F|nr:HAMP domain-containing sensor histidine kinase [Paenibacillus sp. HB172176]